MSDQNPIDLSKDELSRLVDIIKSDTAVGIDAQYTHAIILKYLENISNRLEKLENKILNN